MSVFTLTEEAAELTVRTLSEDGYLDLYLERLSDNNIAVSLRNGSLTVMKLEDVSFHTGNTLTLSGIKVKLDLEGGM